MRPALVLGALLLSSSARADEGDPRGHEEFRFLGWNEACSAALRHLRHPPAARGIRGEPSWGRVGVLTLPPGGSAEKARWRFEHGGSLLWDEAGEEHARLLLERAGYTRQGWSETVRPDPPGRPGGAQWNLLSTATLRVPHGTRWPPPVFRIGRVHYSPLGTCALVVFERDFPIDAFRYKLVRVDPGARRRRALLHAGRAADLYAKGELDAAVTEATAAATLDPELPEGRYRRALLWAAEGRFDEALGELDEAVRRAPDFAAPAARAPEFEDLRKDPRFREIVSPKPRG